MTNPGALREGPLVGVQVLRGAAALSVAVHHAQHEGSLFAAATGQSLARIDAVPWVAGIDVFFVISGFIMVYASERLFGRPGAPRRFLARRVARIVPLYWAATSAFLALALVRPEFLNAPVTDGGFVLASYLFIPQARPDGTMAPVYSLGWTLNYEMFFYALFALAILLPRRRAVLALSAALVALVALGQVLPPLPQPAAFWTAPIVLEFALGMGLGLARAEGMRLPGAVRALLALGGLATLIAAGWLGRGGDLWLTAPAAAMLAAAAALGSREHRPGGPLLRPAALIGDASYALYLLHPFAIRACRLLLEAAAIGPLLRPWAFIALALGMAVALAALVFLALERPLTRWMRGVLDPPARAVP